MAWVCVTKGGFELKFKNRPYRYKLMRDDVDNSMWSDENCEYKVLPKGSIKKLIGRELNWSDEAVELK